jgi:hypothetical protein
VRDRSGSRTNEKVFAGRYIRALLAVIPGKWFLPNSIYPLENGIFNDKPGRKQ